MLRGIFIAVALVAGIALVAFGPGWLMENANPEASLDQPGCNLMTDTCRLQADGGEWLAQLTELSDEQGRHRFQLDLTGDTPSAERVVAVLRGESMYLGEYPVVLKVAEGSGHWRGVFTPPVCTVQDTMVWRIDLPAVGAGVEDGQLRLVFEVQRK